MTTVAQVTTLQRTINARANAMRTQTLGSSAWRTAYNNLLTVLRQAQTIIRAGRAVVIGPLQVGAVGFPGAHVAQVPGRFPVANWNSFVTTANRQAESALAEQGLVAAGADRRPSEGGQTAAQIRAFDATFAGGAPRGTPENPWSFTGQDAPAASAEDIAWARRQQEQPRTRVATATPTPSAYVPPATVSAEPSAVPPSTTATGKTAPTAADIAAAPWRYGAQPAATPGQPPLRVQQAGVLPGGTLTSIRNWLNPTDKPVYLRPWFLATGATAVGLLTYVGYQSMAGAPEEQGEG
jgi:hypothetical protein